ncbi:MAG: Asp-tRNA(Asn)/Glu-tRNA(Gln) amidotransferase subunit GatA [Lachnospiraceae bacterium]|nr:Asp-tRNA(Asn)/Glu-tRNA(Gln) amidotransferase subunit GatA [Lachnospiraceae bacterium]
MELLSLSAVELGAAIREGRTTAVEAVEAVFARIEKLEGTLHCYITLDKKRALDNAVRVQKKIEAKELQGPLAGVPVAMKDNLSTEGMLTTCASKILKNYIPSYSAQAVLQLEKAGAILIGKTNMDEFAMGSTTETSAYGVTRNPHNPEHVPGGSSGGSAAAVAAGECFFALGSDTGGSVRQPASYCGVVGMKPTYGTVSRYGLVAYGSSLDQIGPLCKNVEDCAAVMEIIAAFDEKDSTQIARKDTDFTSALIRDVKGMRIGIPRAYMGENPQARMGKNPEIYREKSAQGLDTEVRDAVWKAAELLRSQGAVVEEFDLDLVEYAIPAYYTIASAEASSNLERFDGVKYGLRAQAQGLHQMYKKTRSQGFGPEVKRRIMLGSYVLSSGYYDAYYLKALRVKAMLKQAFDRAFAAYDCILGPVAPSTAPKLGESLSDPIKMYLGDIYTIAVNLAGLPGISIPCGMDGKGLPIGLQLIGDCFQEKKLLRAAYTYEQRRNELLVGEG